MNSQLIVVIFSILAMSLAWRWQQKRENAGIVDVVWAFGMMLAGPWYALNGSGAAYLRLCLGVLVLCWFLRLGMYLAKRVFNEQEDGRYRAMRLAMKQHASVGFLIFFLLQAGFVWLLSLPFWAVAQNMQPQLPAVVIAFVIVLFALWGESTSDNQLNTFRLNPANKALVCRVGWWRYSRHPNYFFEWLHWLAYPLLGWGGEYQVWLWLAPATMFCFLYFVTGIPFTEQQALRSRGEDYRKYQQTTPMFFPWFPKSD
jgi:cyclopropane-fatty-acyl-phospholipid synthase